MIWRLRARPTPTTSAESPRQVTADVPDDAAWVCPSPVTLPGDEIVAALYAFSDLVDDCPLATPAAVLDELRYVVARHGTAAIEHASEWLVIFGAASLPGFVTGATLAPDPVQLETRLARYRDRAAQLFADHSTEHSPRSLG
jgi:hypothetical protein